LVPGRDKDLAILQTAEIGFGAYPALIPYVPGALFLRVNKECVKLLTHLHLVQKERMHGAISRTPLSVLIVSCFITHSDKFAVPYLSVLHTIFL
jgi:hypothetical protein